MKHVRVRITAHGQAGDIHPMYGVLTETSFVERATAVQWNYTGDALGILHYVIGDAEALEKAMQKVPEVVGYDMERIDGRSCYVYVRDATTDSLREMFDPLTSGGLIAVPPIEYESDGTVVFSLFGPDDEIQDAIEGFSVPVDVTIEEVGNLTSTAATIEATFTDRQREVAKTAVQLGYYDIPRSAGQEDIAAELDCAPSTIAEHLRKVEARILRAQFA
ncbi:Predicted DNA binding protein, contains HTH domain [Natronorubrum sediminis]|uniref:Predicted DNA binding protein, contains HTH domain n=1 Tax=Natronorubrum sediminis TaxID=640943 RepID=A0A1H6G3H9_9EURY|nr:helix-turn-helix domain-containing protein [Natronorubrum sediminis]SEH16445.1 Predicted DNA binding protein, contains HTH domain [Natronorubrum sediminis]